MSGRGGGRGRGAYFKAKYGGGRGGGRDGGAGGGMKRNFDGIAALSSQIVHLVSLATIAQAFHGSPFTKVLHRGFGPAAACIAALHQCDLTGAAATLFYRVDRDWVAEHIYMRLCSAMLSFHCLFGTGLGILANGIVISEPALHFVNLHNSSEVGPRREQLFTSLLVGQCMCLSVSSHHS